MNMASKTSFFIGVFRASAWMTFVFFAFCLSLLSPYLSMSRLMVSVVLVFENWENLPASAPTSMIVFVCDKLMEFWMKWVSICVRYLPMRVFAACSQWVSVEMFSAKTGSLQGLLSVGFYFDVEW